jgi:signal transduction histidine kinase
MGQPLRLEREPMDLVRLVRKLSGEYQNTGRPTTIQVRTRAETLLGSWDFGRLERVLANVLDNAVKYSPEGARIGIELHTEVSPDNAWAVLRIQDEGLGIPADDLPHVFERFFRGSNVAQASAGTGLGLSGARQVVQQHGGQIDLDSELGVGTRVTIRLPLLTEEQLTAS